MSSTNCKSDGYPLPKRCQGKPFGNVGCFKAAYVKIGFNELLRDVFEMYRHAIPPGVCMKWVKERSTHEPCSDAAKAWKRAIKSHSHYFVLGFIFLMSSFFQEVICYLRWAHAQCSLNAVRMMVVFLNLSKLFDLILSVNEF